MKNESILTISETAKILGVTKQTLRLWEKSGKLLPDERTLGNQRRYRLSSIQKPLTLKIEKKTIAYARVSTNEQKKDLIRQKELLEMFCVSNGWSFEGIDDLGSGMNYHKKV